MDKYLYKLHIKGIQHIGIPTQKYQETLDFYRSLGFEIINQENYQGHRVAFLRIHNVMLEVYESETTADATGSIDHIALSGEGGSTVPQDARGIPAPQHGSGAAAILEIRHPLFQGGRTQS